MAFAASQLNLGADGHSVDDNLLQAMFGFTPTGIERGLRRLIGQLDELTPLQGVGTIQVKRFTVRITNSTHSATELLRAFRSNFGNVMPIDVGVEPVAPGTKLEPGAVVTMALPGRGHVQIRVEEVTDDHVVVSTLRGHALAGFVRFSVLQAGAAIQFEVMPCDSAANLFDWISLTLGGARLQDANWVKVVENVARLAGGTATDVETDERKLSDEEADTVEGWIQGVIRRQRAVQDVRGPRHGISSR
jgi:NADH dehydrogenase